ncbi:MAG TPA: hypothetical protein P5044_10925, partial [bacterium]|nr:hypothetical protein [bacterium]
MIYSNNNQKRYVLVSWVSVNHKEAPLITAIDNPGSPFYSKIDKLYLCWRDSNSDDNEREHQSLKETVKKLENDLAQKCPEIVKVPWKTAASPTDHTALRPFAEECLKTVRRENPDAHIVIHLSPGTPAMHAVWLLLGTTSFVEGPISLIQ